MVGGCVLCDKKLCTLQYNKPIDHKCLHRPLLVLTRQLEGILIDFMGELHMAWKDVIINFSGGDGHTYIY